MLGLLIGSKPMTEFIKQSESNSCLRQAFQVSIKFFLYIIVAWSASFFSPVSVLALESPSYTAEKSDGAAVVLNDKVLFRIYIGAGSVSATKRAENVTAIIKDLIEDPEDTKSS